MDETLAPDSLRSTSSEPADFRKQCLLICVVSALIALASRWPAALLLVAAAGSVFADAWAAGIGRQTNVRGLNRISPPFWGIFAGLFPILVLPVYLFYRSRLSSRKGNKFAQILVIVVACAILLLLPFMPVSLLVGPFD